MLVMRQTMPHRLHFNSCVPALTLLVSESEQTKRFRLLNLLLLRELNTRKSEYARECHHKSWIDIENGKIR